MTLNSIPTEADVMPSSAQAIDYPELHAPSRPEDAPALKSLHPLYQVKARLQVCVGEATVTVGELLAAKQHQVLRLDRLLDEPVDLMVEGKIIARGHLVAVDGHFAVRLSELPQPMTLASS
jgi:flagellar motor switch protein FliN